MNNSIVALRVQDILETAKQVLNEIQTTRARKIEEHIERAKQEIFKKNINDTPGYIGRIWRSIWNKPAWKVRYTTDIPFEEARLFLVNEQSWHFGNTWYDLNYKFPVEETLEKLLLLVKT